MHWGRTLAEFRDDPKIGTWLSKRSPAKKTCHLSNCKSGGGHIYNTGTKNRVLTTGVSGTKRSPRVAQISGMTGRLWFRMCSANGVGLLWVWFGLAYSAAFLASGFTVHVNSPNYKQNILSAQKLLTAEFRIAKLYGCLLGSRVAKTWQSAVPQQRPGQQLVSFLDESNGLQKTAPMVWFETIGANRSSKCPKMCRYKCIIAHINVSSFPFNQHISGFC